MSFPVLANICYINSLTLEGSELQEQLENWRQRHYVENHIIALISAAQEGFLCPFIVLKVCTLNFYLAKMEINKGKEIKRGIKRLNNTLK